MTLPFQSWCILLINDVFGFEFYSGLSWYKGRLNEDLFEEWKKFWIPHFQTGHGVWILRSMNRDLMRSGVYSTTIWVNFWVDMHLHTIIGTFQSPFIPMQSNRSGKSNSYLFSVKLLGYPELICSPLLIIRNRGLHSVVTRRIEFGTCPILVVSGAPLFSRCIIGFSGISVYSFVNYIVA